MRSKTGMKRAFWVDSITSAVLSDRALDRAVMLELSTLDEILFEAWNLGENIVIAWTQDERELHFLAVRHYELLEPHDYNSASADGEENSQSFIDAVLVGPKCIEAADFARLRAAFGTQVGIVRARLGPYLRAHPELISGLVTRYTISPLARRFFSVTNTRICIPPAAPTSPGRAPMTPHCRTPAYRSPPP